MRRHENDFKSIVTAFKLEVYPGGDWEEVG